MQRVTSPEGWYADVPTAAGVSSDDAVEVRVLRAGEKDEEDEEEADGVHLIGDVLHRGSDAVMVSCGGLLARVSPQSVVHDRERVHILVRNQDRRRSRRA